MTETTAFQAPRGVPDYIPPQSNVFAAVRENLLIAAQYAGYALIELPFFEDTALFARGVGQSTDVVTKEMYTFADRAGRSLTLRPEGTAGTMRAVIQHGLDRGQLPVKLSYAGPCFRYENPQSGRYRQFQQVGVEAIGIDDPAIDAEVIAVADEGFRRLGLRGYRLELASLGDGTCRPLYRETLANYLAQFDLDEPTRQRAEVNPLRILDDKRPELQDIVRHAPLMIDYLSESAREHFDAVCRYLTDLGIAYDINPRLVRGLDYYTKTTFEFVYDGLGAQSGIGGGGRYDGLMEQLGGRNNLSGIGFGLGIDRTMLAAQMENLFDDIPGRCAVFIVPIGAEARRRAVSVAGRLRSREISVDIAYGDRGLKGAMKAADKSGAQFALVLGEREIEQETVVMKNLGTGEQESVPMIILEEKVVLSLHPTTV